VPEKVRLTWGAPWAHVLNVLAENDIAHRVHGQDLIVVLRDGSELTIHPGQVLELSE